MKKIKEARDDFVSLIDPSNIQIKTKLPFIWVFGASGKNSKRYKFLQWHLNTPHDLSKYLTTIEDYQDWLHFNQYSNLVDFELDIAQISQAIIIFSEGPGAISEIGMLSCFKELHKNILIIVDEDYIKPSTHSFFNHGPIKKIRDNQISSETTNIWSLDKMSYSPEELNNIFRDILDHVYDIITFNKNTVILDKQNKYHIIILVIDIIDLFPGQVIKFYNEVLSDLGIIISNSDIKSIFTLLSLIKIIEPKLSGKNTFYSIRHPQEYISCLNYQAKRPKRFERAEFKIRWS